MSEEGVTYSFKDLFDKLDERLNDGFGRLEGHIAEMRRSLEGKADNTRVATLEAKQAQFEVDINKRFKPLEEFVLTNSATALLKGRGIAWLATLVIAVISALIYVSATGGFH